MHKAMSIKMASKMSSVTNVKSTKSLQSLTASYTRFPGMSASETDTPLLTNFNVSTSSLSVPRKEFNSETHKDRAVQSPRHCCSLFVSTQSPIIVCRPHPSRHGSLYVISNTSIHHLSGQDCPLQQAHAAGHSGVGILGFQTDISQNVMKICVGLELGAAKNSLRRSVIWGSRNLRVSPATGQ
ncbi:hypothetical protein Btru_040341 [Bulinus truncatus]|nr:hypothetical protein Btru_040341 [Bulinus truncatus]